MKKTVSIAVGLGALLASMYGMAQMGMGGMMGGSGVSVQRHRLAMRGGLPASYASARNPLESTAANVDAGKALFQQNCAACHGASGRGDGPAAAGLNPRPANVAAVMGMPIAGDSYLDWTISEGGGPTGSAMPVFKANLTQRQIWQVILYLRTL